MWKKIKQWIFSVKASWIGLTLFSIPLFSFTFLQITFQPTLVINVNNIPGVDGERSKNPFTVHNAEGQDVRFSIWTLTADYSWAFGYDGTIDDNYPARLNDALEKLPLSQQQRDGLNSAEEIICIGASSQESKAGLNNTDEGRRIE